MRKHINTTAPVIPGGRYMEQPLQRLNWNELLSLIDDKNHVLLYVPVVDLGA